MYDFESARQPAAPFVVEHGQHRGEVVFIFGACSLRFEEQNDFGTGVRDPFGCSFNQAGVRHADLTVTSADPGLAFTGLAEDVEAPKARRRLSHPRLMRI